MAGNDQLLPARSNAMYLVRVPPAGEYLGCVGGVAVLFEPPRAAVQRGGKCNSPVGCTCTLLDKKCQNAPPWLRRWSCKGAPGKTGGGDGGGGFVRLSVSLFRPRRSLHVLAIDRLQLHASNADTSGQSQLASPRAGISTALLCSAQRMDGLGDRGSI